MGCDAHMYVEYKNKESNNKNWTSFGNRINPGRNYWMFGLIAGVRSEFIESYNAKGIPIDLAYSASSDFKLFICNEPEPGCCTLDDAKRYQSYGRKIEYRDGEPIFVEHPDWHTPTWLTIEEFENVITTHNKMDYAHKEPEYEAILSAMKKLEEFNNEVRIIIWFDN